MGTMILRRDNGKGCLLKMDDKSRLEIEKLGALAWKLIEDRDPFLCSFAEKADLSKFLKEGIKILRHFGLYQILELSDREAHQAFVTACVLAFRVDNLSTESRSALRQAIEILGQCCLIRIDRVPVPAFKTLPRAAKNKEIVVKIYREILASKSVSIADALRLAQELEGSRSRTLQPFIDDLREVTEGLSESLKRTEVED